MRFLALLSTFSALLSVTLASPITSKPLALVHTYARAQDCDADNAEYSQLPIYEDAKCVSLPEGTATLKVVDSEKTKLRYNSRKCSLPI
jgi:hypothetical protein